MIDMADNITEETIEYVSTLAKLDLTGKERQEAMQDMNRMLGYIDRLNELDTTGVKPMSHVFPLQNVFREDEVTNGDGSEDTLKNAPEEKDTMFVAPKAIE